MLIASYSLFNNEEDIHESDPTRCIVVIRVTFFQTELMVEICSESLVRAIGKELLMKFS